MTMVSKSTKFFRTIALFIVLTAVAYVATGLLVGKSDAAVQADPPMGVCPGFCALVPSSRIAVSCLALR
jgi:hypothetical protein